MSDTPTPLHDAMVFGSEPGDARPGWILAKKLERELAECRAALRELVALDYSGAVVSMNAMHNYGCPCTRHGKRFGTCNCPGDEMQSRIDRAIFAARAIVGKGISSAITDKRIGLMLDGTKGDAWIDAAPKMRKGE